MIGDARLLRTSDGPQLEVTQQLRLSRTMLDALSAGIPLRLVYRIEGCTKAPHAVTVELRYAALTRHYELHSAGADARRFARRGAMLAALDRIRLPLPAAIPDDCDGEVSVALDLTSLPTPLRFPALLQPDQWRLVSPATAWHAARG